MALGRFLEPLVNNQCRKCGAPTTAEGFFCRKHWDLVEGAIKGALMHNIDEALTSIYVNGNMKRG